MYDIIGDIHGQAQKLIQLLRKLGYRETAKGWQHSTYKAVFVGDFIDRGPFQIETLQIIRDMMEQGNAYAVMGNHEFNAIGWATEDIKNSGEFLRRHNHKHRKQHQVFLEQSQENSEGYWQWIRWFKQLPIYLQLDGINVIHACWDIESINRIRPYLSDDNQLLTDCLPEAYNEEHELFQLCETLLKGKEILLEEPFHYLDKDGFLRKKSRIRWWLEEAKDLKSLCLLPEDQIENMPNFPVNFHLPGYQEKAPAFFGHYWFTGTPQILTTKLACVDYSAAIESGKLVAYRWSGEQKLSNENLIYLL